MANPILTQKRVLILETDPVVREIIKKVLDALGYRIFVVNGRKAEEEYVPEEIDLLLVDLDGLTSGSQRLLERLKVLYPFAPVIIMTGRPDLYRSEQAVGTVTVMEKPVRGAALLSAIGELRPETEEARQRRTGVQSETNPAAAMRIAQRSKCLPHTAAAYRPVRWRSPGMFGGRRRI